MSARCHVYAKVTICLRDCCWQELRTGQTTLHGKDDRVGSVALVSSLILESGLAQPEQKSQGHAALSAGLSCNAFKCFCSSICPGRQVLKEVSAMLMSWDAGRSKSFRASSDCSSKLQPPQSPHELTAAPLPCHTELATPQCP